jgi:cellulose biosynthesis protein BcsQ
MNQIITFYSYKGGVGRTMCLANTAVLLAEWGYSVLIVDWDLEAPGLEYYFKNYIEIEKLKKLPGIINLLEEKPATDSLELYTVSIDTGKNAVPIKFIPSGKRDDKYFDKVRDFNIDKYYENGGGDYIEDLRDTWKANYDFVLIDSRTGVTELNGICTVQLPDLIVTLFTTNEQGFLGTLDISNRILEAQQKLSYERQKLIFLPIPTKFDTQAEFKLSDFWLNDFSLKLDEVYRYWLPKGV